MSLSQLRKSRSSAVAEDAWAFCGVGWVAAWRRIAWGEGEVAVRESIVEGVKTDFFRFKLKKLLESGSASCS